MPSSKVSDYAMSPRGAATTGSLTRRSNKDLAMAFSFSEQAELKPDPLPWSIKLGYGLPQFSMLSLTLVISIYGNPYYEKMGAGLSFIAFFTALARSFDVMTDPLMGWISDNTRLKFGRRRPYMLTGMFGFSIFFTLLMIPPFTPADSSSKQTSYWFGFFYVVFYIFDTIANVPYQALGPELTTDPQERTTAFFFGKAFATLGTLIGATSPQLFKMALGGGDDIPTLRKTFFYIALIFGSLYIVFMTIVILIAPERHLPEDTQQMPIVPSILRSFKNRAFRPLVVGWIADAIALSTIAAMVPFFIEYVIIPKTLSVGVTQMYCFGALFCSALASMPMWKFIAGKYGRYQAWMAFNVLNFVTNALYIIVAEGDPWYTIGITFLNGIPLGGAFLTDAILADVIDYDTFLNGSRNEGGFTVFSTFIPKFVSVPAGALPLSIMAMIGFKPSINGVSQPQPDAVKNFIRFMFVVVPCLCQLVALFAKRFYPLKTEDMVDELRRGIDAHHQGEAYPDPITHEMVEPISFEHEEDLKLSWTLDAFSHRQLSGLLTYDGKPALKAGEVGEDPESLANGHPDKEICSEGVRQILFELKAMVLVGVVVTTVFLALTGAFFPSLDDPAISIIPILSVVSAGMCMCFTVVNVMRLLSAYSLRKDINTELVQQTIDHKRKGQRGGEGLDDAEGVSKAVRTSVELALELVAKDAKIAAMEKELLKMQSLSESTA